MLRAAALSLLVLFSIATMLPLAHSTAQDDGSRSASSQRRKKRVRRHSRAWWRRYRAHLRRRRAAAAALRGEQKPVTPENDRPGAAISPSAFYSTGGTYNDPRGAFSLTMPIGWSNRPLAAGGELRFRVYASDGRAVGQAALSVVPATASVALSAKAKARSLGGVSFADLNRTVIDKMVTANGWVINDLVREINGRRVFIVLAQTAASPEANLPQQSWAFYFTEMDGRIYSLAVSAPLEFSDRMAQESEQVMASFRLKSSSTLAEKTAR
ncbi:MAG: hypothetical protein WCF57_03105 [Pyrinomonadaceae bacterium]